MITPVYESDFVQVAIDRAMADLPLDMGRGEMQRDMELVRVIFRRIIDKSDLVAKEIQIEGHDPAVVRRHIAMLYNDGYIDGTHFDGGSEGRKVLVVDLSWAGHEFAGTIVTEDGVWQKVKAAFGPEKLATVPLKMIEKVAYQALEAWALKQMGL